MDRTNERGQLWVDRQWLSGMMMMMIMMMMMVVVMVMVMVMRKQRAVVAAGAATSAAAAAAAAAAAVRVGAVGRVAALGVARGLRVVLWFASLHDAKNCQLLQWNACPPTIVGAQA